MSGDPTLGQQMSRNERRRLNEAVIESNYKGGQVFVPLQYKADDDPDFMQPVKFEGFANVGGPDLGDDIVDPKAFTKQTLNEFLKFGRQLLFMHNSFAQVGEITAAEVVLKGTRSMFGITDGGLKVKGFVDSPIDEELGYVPDHELAKIIHFARMQVRKGRLKLLSIGWRPTKTRPIKAKDPRRQNQERTFRLVEKLILGEISLVTMAMSPRAMIEAEAMRKAFSSAYGDEIADAMFCDGIDESCEMVPEDTPEFTLPHIKRLLVEALQGVTKQAAPVADDTPDGNGRVLEVVSLESGLASKYDVMSLD